MTETITSGQRKQLVRFCEDALAVLEIRKDAAQRVIELGGDFQAGLSSLITKLGTLDFADEEVERNFGYPEGFRIQSVQAQAEALLALEPFKNLDASHVAELASGELPEGAEGWGVFPKPNKVAKGYHNAQALVLKLLAASRQFKNWREEGKLTENHLRLAEKTAKAHANLDEQPGDFWVVPFQFGLRHGRRSVRQARVLFTENEFGLGVYETAVLLLTHPGRITGHNQLYVNCAGVEYAPNADGDFLSCFFFVWIRFDERLLLYDLGADIVSTPWGSGSGFLV